MIGAVEIDVEQIHHRVWYVRHNSQSSRPTSIDLLRMWPVSKRVNVSRRGGDDPSLIEPVEDAAIADGYGIELRHVWTLHPKLHVARTGRALSAHPARAQLAPPLQYRADNGDRRREIGGDRPRAYPDALGPHSRLVEKDSQGSAIDVQRTGRDGRAKADVPLGLQTHPLHRASVRLLRVAARSREASNPISSARRTVRSCRSRASGMNGETRRPASRF